MCISLCPHVPWTAQQLCPCYLRSTPTIHVPSRVPQKTFEWGFMLGLSKHLVQWHVRSIAFLWRETYFPVVSLVIPSLRFACIMTLVYNGLYIFGPTNCWLIGNRAWVCVETGEEWHCGPVDTRSATPYFCLPVTGEKAVTWTRVEREAEKHVELTFYWDFATKEDVRN